MKTSNLIGPALDWAVAKCEITKPIPEFDYFFIKNHENGFGHYATDWSQSGPIIERERIRVHHFLTKADWGASLREQGWFHGPTPLIAAMRCYVASKLGDNVEIPEELK